MVKTVHGVMVASAAVVLAGCGASGPGDDPAESAEFFLQALAEGDTAKMCEVSAFRSESYTGPVDSGQWTQSECESDLNEDYESYLASSELGDVEVGEPRIEGDEADISPDQLDGWPDVDYGIKLQRFDGQWYVVDALGT